MGELDSSLGPVGTEMARRIEAALAPRRLRIVDETAEHMGHGGYNPEGESHFRVAVEADAFAALSRVERVRAVQKAVGDLLTGGRIHALSIDARP